MLYCDTSFGIYKKKDHIYGDAYYKCLSLYRDANYSNNSSKERGQYIFVGNGTPEAPQIGDCKILFWAVQPDSFSIIAEQRQRKLVAKDVENGVMFSSSSCDNYSNDTENKFTVIGNGNQSIDSLFRMADSTTDSDLLFRRFLGYVCVMIGFLFIFELLRVLPDSIPVIGGFIERTFARITITLATFYTFTISSVTWLIYNDTDKFSYREVVFIFMLLVGLLVFLLATIPVKRYYYKDDEVYY
ncbi:TMEM43 family protein [Flammeovirga aprica]|uniref:Uncharacterized protein n=1 Tax=Flammeovirga aprica JL-4 TaxID=694437 RepID=A0A7X9P3R6_9BACT|nr:TMEM43 family protein [Flammeovirga aprica]NME68602.1 hypothetical protein [Flammeovirga aprica JL-4]